MEQLGIRLEMRRKDRWVARANRRQRRELAADRVRSFADPARVARPFQLAHRDSVDELEHNERDPLRTRPSVQDFRHRDSAMQLGEQTGLFGVRAPVAVVKPENDVVAADVHSIVAVHQPAAQERRGGDWPLTSPRFEQTRDVVDVDRNDPTLGYPVALFAFANNRHVGLRERENATSPHLAAARG